MRKSERLRLLEIELIKLRMEVDLMRDIIATLIDSQVKDLDSGKWYQRRPDLGN
jgi:hypothetical protein